MEKALKLMYGLCQILFYIFSGLTIIAFIFWLFGSERFFTVGNLLLTTIGFLVAYIVFFRLYAYVAKQDKTSSLQEDFDNLKNKK